MKLTTINTGFFKLDGGAMFGVVPRRLWERVNPPDEINMCTWAMRALLIETGDRKILVDTGIGAKQSDKFRSHFSPHRQEVFEENLRANMLQPEEITDVFLTHLHFDHVGGAVTRDEKGNLAPLFPNATYWSNEVHWKAAMQPNAREKASFLQENFVPLKEQGKLQFLDYQKDNINWLPNIDIQFAHGHTDAMMVLHLQLAQQKVIYCADLMPSAGHIPLPYVMAYDIRPLVTLAEKEVLLSNALENKDILIFEHDPKIECGTLKRNERGRIVLDERGDLEGILR